MKVLILDKKEAAIQRAARLVADLVASQPDAVLGLATGGTMVPLYAQLRCMHLQEGLSFARISTFNLDEYVGLEPEHPASYHSYMRNVLFDHVDIDHSRTFLPRGNAPDVHQEAERYEARIKQAGGIDLQLLGIGQNGHIGFNEPTSSLASLTRVKTLAASTLAANAPYFDCSSPPKFALTMGIGSILASSACLLLATGASKASAVAAAIEGAVSAACPASALQLHPRATIVLDQDAAADLKLSDYYHHVHPSGRESDLDRPR